MEVYIKSYGKFFCVRCIARNEKEANEFMLANDECGVLCEENGLVFIADISEADLFK